MNSETNSEVVRVALHKPTDKFIHIENIVPTDKSIRNNCYCLKCDEKLEAVLEFKDKSRVKFFRHSKNPNCKGAQETALHELGKQILLEHRYIQIPTHGLITYSEPQAEKRLEKIRPDISAISNDQPVHFEVFVSHFVDERKDLYIKRNKIKAVEIDLSSERTSTYDEIKRKVLDSVDNKRIIFWEANTEGQTTESTGCILQVLTFIVILLGLISVLSNRN